MTRLRAFFGVLIACCAATLFAQTAELHPGTLQGTVSFSGETVSNGWLNAYSNDSSGFNAYGSFTGSTYSLTVEGGHSYRMSSLNAQFSMPEGSSYMYVSGSQQNAFVPVNGSATLDFTYAAARIASSITVVGGQLSSVQLRATANTTYEYFDAYANYSTNFAAMYIPMVATSAVRVFGTAYIIPTGGSAAVAQSLDPQTIDLTASGAALQWTVDLNAAKTGIAGSFSLTPSDIVANHYVWAYGYGGGAQNIYAFANADSSGMYSIFGMVPGQYNVGATTYFKSPYGWLQWPYRQLDVTASNITQNDYTSALGFMHGKVTVSGFIDNSKVSYAYVQAVSPNFASWASGLVDAAGNYNIAAPADSWAPILFSLSINNYDPSQFVSASIYGSDYSRSASYGGTPTVVQAGADVAAPGFDINTVQSQLIFDVQEPVGQPEVMISNARLDAYGTRQDASGRWLGYRQFSAYGGWTSQAHPAVTLIGEPGVYRMRAWGTVNGSQVQFGDFDFTLQPPQQTPTGSNVTVAPSSNVTLQFSNVTSPGVTSVTQAPVGPAAPPNFKVLSPGGTPVYYDISTTATFSGSVNVCVQYDDTGLTARKESQLKLYHYNAATSVWQNITNAGSPNVVTNTLCGTTNSFSVFAVMYSENQPPVIAPTSSFSVAEGDRVTLSITATDADGDALTAAWDLDGDGNFNDATGFSAVYSAAMLNGPSTRTVKVRVSDGKDTVDADVTINITNVAPVITSITLPTNAVRATATASVDGAFTDAGKLDTHTAVWQWGDGSTSAAAIAEMNGSGTASGTHVYLAAGLYPVALVVTDSDGASVTAQQRYVVVYDPDAGFVTGGGFIEPAAGKATFGFNAKYLKGDSSPKGEVQIDAPGVKLHASSFEWLVVASGRAILKGTGSVNGGGDYGVLISATANNTMRIKIWDRATLSVIYDSEPGAAVDAVPTTAVTGSISIHQ